MVTVWIVRHGCAGHKDQWHGDDDERPLDPTGAAQAAALADVLVEIEPRRLLSSPTRRCVDTLQPLADRLGLPVDVDARLCPQHGFEPLMALIGDPSFDGTVVCAHGEAMRPLLSALRRHGVAVIDDEPDARLLLKGVAWEVATGDPLRLRLHAPVPVRDCPNHPPMRV